MLIISTFPPFATLPTCSLPVSAEALIFPASTVTVPFSSALEANPEPVAIHNVNARATTPFFMADKNLMFLIFPPIIKYICRLMLRL